MKMIAFDSNKKAIGSIIHGTADIEVGSGKSMNTFEVKGKSFENAKFIAIPGTEYGGVIERSEEGKNTLKSGYTWRGLLSKWLIEPIAGNDYYIANGDLNDIIAGIMQVILGGFFTASADAAGVTASNYAFPLHCTVLEGLMKLCSDHGCKLMIRSKIVEGILQVVISAVPVARITLPESAFSATVTVDQMGVNHLVCWGKGELQNRIRKDIYLQPDGNITYNQYYVGFAERQAVYENSSYETETEFVNGAIKRLSELASYTRMTITEVSADQADIGDILIVKKGNLVTTAPVVRKILKMSGRSFSIETRMDGQK